MSAAAFHLTARLAYPSLPRASTHPVLGNFPGIRAADAGLAAQAANVVSACGLPNGTDHITAKATTNMHQLAAAWCCNANHSAIMLIVQRAALMALRGHADPNATLASVAVCCAEAAPGPFQRTDLSGYDGLCRA